MGMFYPFIEDETVKLYGVEAAGHGLNTPLHASSLTKGKPGGAPRGIHVCFCRTRTVRSRRHILFRQGWIIRGRA